MFEETMSIDSACEFMNVDKKLMYVKIDHRFHNVLVDEPQASRGEPILGGVETPQGSGNCSPGLFDLLRHEPQEMVFSIIL